MSYIHRLEKSGGFFHNLWIILSCHIYCKKHNLEFIIDDSNWLFKHTYGWRDYFTSLTTISEIHNLSKTLSFPLHEPLSVDDYRLQKYTLEEYNIAFHEVYKLNDSIKEKISSTLNKFSLIPDNYNSVMIRRGCKMYNESYYIETIDYLKNILTENIDIFIQTDDYIAYEEASNIIKSINPNINIYTTCPNTQLGAFVFTYRPELGAENNYESNEKYLQNLTTKPRQKPIIEYTNDELKEHVEEMLVGIEICKKGKYIYTDFQSNSTRIMVIDQLYKNNIICIGNKNRWGMNTIPNFNIPIKCPAHGFIPN
jgi:hypothetical protein